MHRIIKEAVFTRISHQALVIFRQLYFTGATGRASMYPLAPMGASWNLGAASGSHL